MYRMSKMFGASVEVALVFLFTIAFAAPGVAQTVSFSARRDFAISSGIYAGPYAVAVGDFNGDGKPDLAVANWLSSNVSMLLGNGDGTFQAVRNFDVGSGPRSVAVGDFNGDGKPDLAVANYYPSNVSVLLGNGDGSFQAATNFDAGSGPDSVAGDDFNGDGQADLVEANYYSRNVQILDSVWSLAKALTLSVLALRCPLVWTHFLL
jgi:hypothetical protein